MSAGGFDDEIYGHLDCLGHGADDDFCGGVDDFSWARDCVSSSPSAPSSSASSSGPSTADSTYISEGDSSLATSPESVGGLLTPESILEEFLDCEGGF